jgi:hypothetical protein
MDDLFERGSRAEAQRRGGVEGDEGVGEREEWVEEQKRASRGGSMPRWWKPIKQISQKNSAPLRETLFPNI